MYRHRQFEAALSVVSGEMTVGVFSTAAQEGSFRDNLKCAQCELQRP